MQDGAENEMQAARQQLVEAMADAASGETSAVKTIYDMTSAKLFGICLRILQDRPEAEDVLQDVFVTVWSRASDFDASRASPISRGVRSFRSGCRGR